MLTSSSDEQSSLADTASSDGSVGEADTAVRLTSTEAVGCDACPYCDDRCNEPACPACRDTNQETTTVEPTCLPCASSNKSRADDLPYYTRCQVRRHNHEGSAWLIAGDTIYDATSVLHRHPGGVDSILRRAGGAADCTRDFEFHSKSAMKRVKKLSVGKIRRCPCEVEDPSLSDKKEWWVFW